MACHLLQLSKLPLENLGNWKFADSPTGRGYLEADINPAAMKPIRVATTQLERPCKPAPMRCVERYAQAEHAVAALSSAENIVFGGDMCWRDGTDRPFPLPEGWFDAWPEWLQVLNRLHGATGASRGSASRTVPSFPASSWTYDATWEEDVGLFNGFKASSGSMQRRSDLFVCKLKDYSLKGMEIIGPGDSHKDSGLRFANSKRDYDDYFLRTSPSCHRGLLMTIAANEPARPDAP